MLASGALSLQEGNPAISLQDRFPFATQLYQVQRVHRLALDRALESVGVTAPQFGVLVLLQQRPGLSNAELARHRNITPQTMNVIVGRLELAGLIVRTPHPDHGRILLAALTPAGDSVVELGLSRAATVEARVADALEPGEQARLFELLSRVAEALTPAPRRGEKRT